MYVGAQVIDLLMNVREERLRREAMFLSRETTGCYLMTSQGWNGSYRVSIDQEARESPGWSAQNSPEGPPKQQGRSAEAPLFGLEQEWTHETLGTGCNATQKQ
jgi:hypothetical protein